MNAEVEPISSSCPTLPPDGSLRVDPGRAPQAPGPVFRMARTDKRPAAFARGEAPRGALPAARGRWRSVDPKWPFANPPDTVALTSADVLDRRLPVLWVSC